MKSRPVKSLKNEFTNIFLLVVVTASVVLVCTFYLNTKGKQLTQDMMNRNIYTNRIYLGLTNMETSLQSYSRTYDKKIFDVFTEYSDQLENDLDALNEKSERYQSTRDCIRRIQGFNEYQRNLWDSGRLFDIFEYVKTGIADQKNEAQRLIIADELQARQDYLDTRKIYDRTEMTLWVLMVLVLAYSIMHIIMELGKVSKALEENQEIAKALTEHQWNVKNAKLGYYREMDDLSGAMNEMKSEIIHYVRELKNQNQLEKQLSLEKLENEKKNRALVTAKMAALRAQINPHFLFNALNLISQMTYLGKTEETMELTETVSRILRYSLEENRMVTLDRELEVIDSYILLQKARFGDAIRFVRTVPEHTRMMMIPSMIIQPIVENCFKHGMKDRNHLEIRLDIRSEQDVLLITVEDDGNGFDVATLEDRDHAGIGVRNVAERLKLHYKEDNLFSIDSRPGKYTRVTIRIPERNVDENSDS
jgi:two-component sensor histidine kinase